MTLRSVPPIHPGEILRDDFMAPLGLTAGRVARALGVPRTRIERIAREEIGITADTALRLGRYFGTSTEFWMNLQAHHDRLLAEAALGEELARIRPLERDAA